MAYGVKHRLTYCNASGDEFRLDIEVDGYTGSVNPISTDGSPFVLTQNNSHRLPKLETIRATEADINIYEEGGFELEDLLTSSETEIRVSHYKNEILHWRGFVLPEFFHSEISSVRLINMVATDRLGILKDIPVDKTYDSMTLLNIIKRCLIKTGLELNIKTIIGYKEASGTMGRPLETSVLGERMFTQGGDSLNCFDVLKSILDMFSCFLTQKDGYWWIVNKEQLETGEGEVIEYSYETTNNAVISTETYVREEYPFEYISTGGEKIIQPLLGDVSILGEFGGSKLYPTNNNFRDFRVEFLPLPQRLVPENWRAMFDFDARVTHINPISYDNTSNPDINTYIEGTEYKLLNRNENFGLFGGSSVNGLPFLESELIPIVMDSVKDTSIDISYDFNVTTKNGTVVLFSLILETPNPDNKYYVLNNGTGLFEKSGNSLYNLYDIGFPNYTQLIRGRYGFIVGRVLNNDADPLDAITTSITGSVSVDLDTAIDFSECTLQVRIYGTINLENMGTTALTTTLVNRVSVDVKSSKVHPKGDLYRITRSGSYTTRVDTPVSIYSDFMLRGLNGYFYNYPSDDTSNIRKLDSSWTTIGMPSESSPVLLHTVRQMAMLYSVVHKDLVVTLYLDDIDPLGVYLLECLSEEYTVAKYSINYLKSVVSVTLTQIKRGDLETVKEYIYSYFGSETGTKVSSLSSISGGSSGGGGTGNGNARYAETAGYANDSDMWDGNQFDDFLDQPVRKSDSPFFEGVGSEVFSGGLTGEGYKIWKDGAGEYNLELDNIVVRKGMEVYELSVDKIKASNGSIWVTDGIKITGATLSGSDYICTINDDGGTIPVPFEIGDIVRCQIFNSSTQKYYTAKVIDVDTDNFTVTVIDGSDVPEEGDDLVRIGNETDIDRQGALYLTASDSGSPYLDVIDGVTDADLSGKTKVRLGRLDGIVDPDFGTLSGYGIYAEGGYFKGTIYATSGIIGEFNIENGVLTGIAPPTPNWERLKIFYNGIEWHSVRQDPGFVFRYADLKIDSNNAIFDFSNTNNHPTNTAARFDMGADNKAIDVISGISAVKSLSLGFRSHGSGHTLMTSDDCVLVKFGTNTGVTLPTSVTSGRFVVVINRTNTTITITGNQGIQDVSNSIVSSINVGLGRYRMFIYEGTVSTGKWHELVY